jgi:hypothetical protein
MLMLIFLVHKVEALPINYQMHRGVQRCCGHIYVVMTNFEGQDPKMDLSFVRI